MRSFKNFLRIIADYSMLLVHYPLCWIVGKLHKSKTPRLVWGPVPMKNYHYACQAMKEVGHSAHTYVYQAYRAIYTNDDFDHIIDHEKYYYWPFVGKFIRFFLFHHLAFIRSLFKYDVFHMAFDGWCLGFTSVWRFEAQLLHLAGKKIIVIAYGGDTFAYSRMHEPMQRHSLMICYPQTAQMDRLIRERNEYWQIHSDTLIPASSFDQMGRWGLLPFNYITIDESKLKQKPRYSNSDGVNGEVNVFHCPNHRGTKGTEFIVQAVEDLRKEGLKIKLTLIEKMQNSELLKKMYEEADILAEQVILNSYGLNGIEGMAMGLPIICNLESHFQTKVFRVYSYLNECPAVSADPEDVKEQLRILIKNPALREKLGRFGRMYVEKYHSRATSQYMYELMLRKVWHNENVDLLNAFHPLKDNPLKKIHPPIEHGMRRNKLQ